MHSNIQTDEGDEPKHWLGRAMFSRHIMYWISQEAPIKMVMPGFPFKSVSTFSFAKLHYTDNKESNPEKVLGHLPDLGERLGLARLNDMCIDIQKIYKHGAEVSIASDGAAFNGKSFATI